MTGPQVHLTPLMTDWRVRPTPINCGLTCSYHSRPFAESPAQLFKNGPSRKASGRKATCARDQSSLSIRGIRNVANRSLKVRTPRPSPCRSYVEPLSPTHCPCRTPGFHRSYPYWSTLWETPAVDRAHRARACGSAHHRKQ